MANAEPPSPSNRSCTRQVRYEIVASNSNSSCNSGRISPENPAVFEEESENINNGASSPDVVAASVRIPPLSPSAAMRRRRTVSGSKAEELIMRNRGKIVYTAGRPPWYDCSGSQLTKPLIIGICGGSASGKTSVAKKIIKLLNIQWVTLLSMDSFYKVLNADHHHKAELNEYNFDHPSSFDFDLLLKTLQRLKDGKRVEVPIYNFTTHSRENSYQTMYGATVLILEGIMCFYNPDIMEMMDLKIFVDTDADTRLARRLDRDIIERGRDIEGVLKQYTTFVKPSFDSFIAPSMRYADIIVPRGGENVVAIDLIAQHVKARLNEVTHNRAELASSLNNNGCHSAPSNLHLLKQSSQLKGLYTFIRSRQTSRNEFIFYSNRVMRLLFEEALSLMPFEDFQINLPTGQSYTGKRRLKGSKICGVSILRAGESMESALREVVKDCIISKILIQTNPDTLEPELYYLRLPKNIHEYKVLLMDATVATGAAAVMGIRILLEHDVLEENITLVCLLMSNVGVNSVAYAFPQVAIVTAAVDDKLSKNYYILPGFGNFGNRYFGTESDEVSEKYNHDSSDDDEDF